MKQTNVAAAFEASASKKDKETHFKLRITETFMESKIPLNKLNHPSVKQFIKDFTEFECPVESSARKSYVDRVHSAKLEKLQQMVKDKYLYLILDETPDCRNRMVLNIMVGVLEHEDELLKPPYLLSTVFLKACNS